MQAVSIFEKHGRPPLSRRRRGVGAYSVQSPTLLCIPSVFDVSLQ